MLPNIGNVSKRKSKTIGQDVKFDWENSFAIAGKNQ